MRKTLIASAIASAANLHITCYDLNSENFILKDLNHGKRGKKGKAKKDWQR